MDEIYSVASAMDLNTSAQRRVQLFPRLGASSIGVAFQVDVSLATIICISYSTYGSSSVFVPGQEDCNLDRALEESVGTGKRDSYRLGTAGTTAWYIRK
jgi:hypothetical protein